MISPISIPKRITLICIALSGSFFLAAQSITQSTPLHSPFALKKITDRLQPLSIGDKMPDIEFTMINYSSPAANLSDFRGKLIILDFWATWCTNCIKRFPFLDSVQTEFNKKIQVILVNGKTTRDNETKILNFYEKQNIRLAKQFNLPTVIYDTVFSALFPHKAMPHYVFIGPDGKVKAITFSEYVTRENIKALLTDENYTLPLKKDVVDYDQYEDLLDNGNGGNIFSNLIFRSCLTGYLEGMGGGTRHTTDSTIRKITYLNKTILTLYRIAFDFPDNRLILEVKDSGRYFQHLCKEDWTKNLYCYEVTFPISSSQNYIESIMQQELNRSLNLSGRYEVRKKNCLVITKINRRKLSIISKNSDFYIGHDSLNRNLIFLNQSFSNIVNELNSHSSLIFIDNTSISENVDFKIPVAALNNKTLLKKIFQSYGLKVTNKVRSIRMFVLTERDIGKSD